MLLNGSGTEQKDGGDADDHVDGEEDAPSQSEGGHGGSGSPHGDVGCHKGGDGFDKLPKGEGGGQSVALNHTRDERIEGSLHQGVADAEEREGNEHQTVTVAEDG